MDSKLKIEFEKLENKNRQLNEHNQELENSVKSLELKLSILEQDYKFEKANVVHLEKNLNVTKSELSQKICENDRLLEVVKKLQNDTVSSNLLDVLSTLKLQANNDDNNISIAHLNNSIADLELTKQETVLQVSKLVLFII